MLYLNFDFNKQLIKSTGFNFNKCCIWIIEGLLSDADIANLTLTSVVFEFCYLNYDLKVVNI